MSEHLSVVAGSTRFRQHHKPYRLKHALLLIAAFWLLFIGLVSAVITVSRQFNQPNNSVRSASVAKPESTVETFINTDVSFRYNQEILSVKTAPGEIYITPGEDVETFNAAAQMQILFGESAVPANQTSAMLSSEEQIGGVSFQKSVYEHTFKIGSKDYSSYSIEWSGTVNQRRVLLRAEGLLQPDGLPPALAQVLDSLQLNGGGRVLGLLDLGSSDTSGQMLAQQRVVDKVSPAVVKIYHITCGGLMVEGSLVGSEACEVSMGTGFLISSAGHIATNGHVVEYEAEDALVKLLMNNPESLKSFLGYIGLDEQQIASVRQQPQLLAAAISRIYDMPEEAVAFKDKQSVIIASLGVHPLNLRSAEDAKKALNWQDTESVKQAQLLASNYAAKDLLVVSAGSQDGFSASDVAILQVQASDTPYMEFYDERVSQNQRITALGFPGDADNLLTDNHNLNVSTTNGSINAIRAASGSLHTLYQSDVDASRGNSGGPVIDALTGEVLGLLTYRFKNQAPTDAAKSYIRDIRDVEALAEENNLTLPKSGLVQAKWQKGLELFSTNRFSKAKTEFMTVKGSFPPHRLTRSYIEAADKAIAEGRDVKDIPLAASITVSFIGASGASAGVVLVSRHHQRHLAYRLATQQHGLTHHHAGG